MNNRNSLSAKQILSASMLAPSELLKMKENQQFCDNLLALAKWLDSQDVEYTLGAFGTQVGYTEYVCNNPQFKYTMGSYYSRETTNTERVLAVLLLRSAILAGDSFV